MSRAVIAMVAAMVIVVAWYVIGLPEGFAGKLVADNTFVVIMLLTALLCWRAGSRVGSDGAPWRWLAAAHASYVAGMLVWVYYDLWQRVPVPYPSLGDVGFLGYYPFAIVALLLFSRRAITRAVGAETLLDGSIVTVGLGALLYEFLLAPINESQGTGIPLLTSLVWQGGTVLLMLAGASLALLGGGALRSRAIQLVVVAITGMSVSNIAYGRMALLGTYAVGDFVDVGWHVSTLLIGIAALIAVRRPVAAATVAPSDAAAHGYPRTTLTVMSVLAVSGLGGYTAMSPTTDRSTAVVILLMGCLVTARLLVVAAQGGRLARRTRERDRMACVVEASRALEGGLDEPEALRVLAAAAARAVGRTKGEVHLYEEEPDRAARHLYANLSVLEQDQAEAVAGLTSASWPVAGDGQVSHPAVRRATDPSLPAESARLLHRIGALNALVAPIVAHEAVIGHLTLWTPFDESPFGPEDTAAAATISRGAGLAIENARLVTALQHQAFHDALTRAPNRALVLDLLTRSLERARRRGTHVAILFVDLDDFKSVNDSLGHAAGDELLVGIARRLERTVRGGETVGRLGGDEFVVVMEDLADPVEAQAAADRIMQALRAPFPVAGQELTVSASVGVAVSRTPVEAPDELLQRADHAMYGAKRTGKARTAIDGQPPDHLVVGSRTIHRQDVEADLRTAIEAGDLRLVYQPIVDLGSRGITEVEALVRWCHPRWGAIPPADFIPIAEATGLIHPLGRWVLDEACRQAAAWHGPNGGSRVAVSVNLSACQVDHPNLVDDIAATLARTSLPAHRLILEITERVALAGDARTDRTLCGLRAIGVRLAVDDFGTGYSGLGSLRRSTMDILKIDRSFVARLDDADSRDAGIVQAILTLAGVLGLATVAEGIETADQADTLRAMGCEHGQGYYLARPMPPDDLAESLARDHVAARVA